MRTYFIPVIVLLTLSLSACAPPRAEMDKKLAKACVSAIQALSDATDLIEIQKTVFKNGKAPENVILRTVKLDVYFTRNQGVMVEKKYTCSYKENLSMFGAAPGFYSLEKDGEKYGNFDGEILGGIDTLQKIHTATAEAFY